MNHQRRRLTIGGADSSRRIKDDPMPLPSLRIGLGRSVSSSKAARNFADKGEVE